MRMQKSVLDVIILDGRIRRKRLTIVSMKMKRKLRERRYLIKCYDIFLSYQGCKDFSCHPKHPQTYNGIRRNI